MDTINNSTVLSINISKTKGVRKEKIGQGFFIKDFGLENDAHAGKWHRQVSLLAVESIRKMENENRKFAFGDFAENITTQGIILHELPIGEKLKIGDCVLEVSQIGKECHKGCAIKQSVGKCIMPYEGIFAKVIKEGVIKTGDEIKILGEENEY